MKHGELFDKYVFPLLCGGAEKQIAEAYEGDVSARLITAVALMAYTEFMGAVLQQNFARRHSEANFNAFLCYMGERYKALKTAGLDVYDVFRCGLVHNFFVKGKCTIAMKNNPGPLRVFGASRRDDIVVLKPVECGVSLHSNGGYLFVIEKYYFDFKEACIRLDIERRESCRDYDIPSADRLATKATERDTRLAMGSTGENDNGPGIGDSDGRPAIGSS